MFGGVGIPELVLIFLVILLLFGAKRLPEIGSSLGRGIREFKGSLREIEGELKIPQDQVKAREGQTQAGVSTPPPQLEAGRSAEPQPAEQPDREPRRLLSEE